MKKFLVFSLVLLLALCAVGCVKNNDSKKSTISGDDVITENWFVEGLYLKCDNGEDMIIMDPVGENAASPCVMRPKDDSVSFDNLTDGDKIRIKILVIEETYPGKTEVYSIEKLAEGERSDIFSDVMTSLEELGWVK